MPGKRKWASFRPTPKLTPRPKEIAQLGIRWTSAPEESDGAHMMEVAAGQLSQVDYNFGRVMKTHRCIWARPTTPLVIFVIGDNGGSGEGTVAGRVQRHEYRVAKYRDPRLPREANMDDMGGWKSSNLYGVPWGWATNTPFQWTKQVASHFRRLAQRPGHFLAKGHQGKRGEIRSQFTPRDRHRSNDSAKPLSLPQPVSKSMARTSTPIRGRQHGLQRLTTPKAERPPQDTVLSRSLANSGIYHDGWFASTKRFPLAVEWGRY